MPWGQPTGSGGSGNNPYDPAKYQGGYDASTNTPTLTNGVGTDGYWYLTTVAGNNTPGGIALIVDQVIIYQAAISQWVAGVVLANNTDSIIVGAGYSPNSDTVADGQVLSYALGALQGQATQAASDILTLGTTKQDLISSPTDNNIVTTDATGQTKDSGVAISAITTNPMTTLGDLTIGGAGGTPTRLAGNITITPKYLKSVGDGVSATPESWEQIQYSDIAGTPPATTGIAAYSGTTSYTTGQFATLNNYIWVATANTTGNAPSSTSAFWRQVSNVNYTKFALVSVLIGNNTIGNGSYPFSTVAAALTYLGSNSCTELIDYRQTYPEDLAITGSNQIIMANSSVLQGGAIIKSLSLNNGFSNFSSAGIEYVNSSNVAALTFNANTAGGGYAYFDNCRFNVTAAGATAPSVSFAGAWKGDAYFNDCTFQRNITIGGTPALPYNIYFTNCTGLGNVLNISLTANAVVHIYNCDQVNIVSYTAGKIYIDGVPYLSALNVAAAASANNFLSIRNCSMRDPSTGAYGTITGTGAVAYQFLNFDYDRSAYTFAGVAQFNKTSGPVIDWVQQSYKAGSVVNYSNSIWSAQVDTSQVPSNASTDWLKISSYITQKAVLVDSAIGNDSKINTNIFATVQPALNYVSSSGIVRINTYRGSYPESVQQTANSQLLSGIINLAYTQNATLKGLTLKSGFSGFQASNLSLFGQSGLPALLIEGGNVGSNTHIGLQYGSDTPGANSIEYLANWGGSNTHYNCNFNEENNVIINDANSTESQVVFVNSSGTINLDMDTKGLVKIIGQSEGSALVDNDYYVAVGDGSILTSLNAATWTLREYTPAQNFNAVAVNSSGVFVAVGVNGEVKRSTDGVTWTGVVTSTSNNLEGVAVNSAGFFVAVGDSGTIITSPDGTTWTTRTSPTTSYLKSIAVNNSGLFVAAGTNGKIITSPDGINWTLRTSGFGNLQTFLGVGVNSTGLFLVTGTGGTIATSPDGITWTAQTSGTVNDLYGVAVNSSDLFVVDGELGTIITSPDGINWTTRTSGTTNILRDITVNSSGLFVAVGDSGTIITSPDGINWTSRTSGTTAILYDCISNNAGLFVAVGSGGTILTSPDGINWTVESSNIITTINDVVANNSDLFVAVGSSGLVITSSDGISWTPQNSGTTLGLSSVAVNSSGLFVAVGGNSRIISSPDGITWTPRITSGGASLNGIAVNSSGFFVAVGDGAKITTSPNGITWTNRASSSGSWLNGVTVNSSGLFVAVARGGVIISSPDGITWTTQSSGGSYSLYDVAVNSSGLFVAVGSSGKILTSPDGANWTTRTSGTSAALINIAVNSSGLFVVVGTGGIIITSSDGITWTSRTSGTTNNLGGIGVNSTGLFIATGVYGTILNSTNGINWSLQVYTNTMVYRSICVSETTGNFVTSGDAGVIKTSSDYVTWVTRTSGVTTSLYGSTITSGGLYIVVGGNGTIITSPDGINWTSRTSGTTNDLYSVAAMTAIGLIVAVGSGGTILTSPDGTTWTARTSGISTFLRSITITPSNYFVAVGAAGVILTSPDGITWTTRTSGTSNDLYAVNCGVGGLVIAGGFSGQTARSTDLSTWTTGSIGVSSSISGIISNASNVFYAVTLKGYVCKSFDGVNWTSTIVTPASTSLNAISIFENYPVSYTPTVNINNFANGRLIIENVYIGTFNVSAMNTIDNYMSVTDCTMRNPLTNTYNVPTGSGTVKAQLLNFDYDRNAYTFAGEVSDTISGVPVLSLSGSSIFANMQGFTNIALSPVGYLNLNNGTYTFNNITVGATAVTFLAQARIYTVTAVITLISNNPSGNNSSITITPTTAGGAIITDMMPQSITDTSNGVSHTLIFNGTINVSNISNPTTFSLVATALTGGYDFGTTNSLVITGIN